MSSEPGAAVSPTAAVVVDYDAGVLLVDCVASLRANDVEDVVVVENGTAGPARELLAERGLDVLLVDPGANLGYGAAANRGVAAGPASEHALVCNPDLQLHPGALEAMEAALAAEPSWGIVGPRILTPEGTPYPSVRRFPSMPDAVGHALLGPVWPGNPFTRRYGRDVAAAAGDERREADWVSGSCMLIRRRAFEELGGFDERYFMFAEEMDLCWRAHQAGWGVGFVPSAVITHHQGATTARHPYRMALEHHRSAWRFACVSTVGWRRIALPGAAAVLALRLGAACLQLAVARR